MKKKTHDRYLKAKYHEEDLIQVNTASKSISISQSDDTGGSQKIFLTFEAIEELYEEMRKYNK
ncbi:hypothetical protein FT641_18210 [Bacillus paranthracis]|uniref:hypothetical protein n=1 Tax=Bacillus paranthracis TaxID=2026186 RepID=UPI00187995A9|nr:hypothetical protein [Bacillus paranthracis]MBE7114503.1 hypothetical protein [Bacillus paranthracis]MBE7154623.1 hypothetical protein [Bacillus paranthracis]